MKRKFIVEIAELHFRRFEVEAENPKHAKALVNRRAPEVVDCQLLEFSDELPPSRWHVEEEPEP